MRRANRWYYGTRMNRREWTVLDEERRTSLHRIGGPAVKCDNGQKEWWTIFAWHIPETVIYQDGDMDWIRFGDPFVNPPREPGAPAPSPPKNFPPPREPPERVPMPVFRPHPHPQEP